MKLVRLTEIAKMKMASLAGAQRLLNQLRGGHATSQPQYHLR